jgi:polysaccharide biosynthesis/export protein
MIHRHVNAILVAACVLSTHAAFAQQPPATPPPATPTAQSSPSGVQPTAAATQPPAATPDPSAAPVLDGTNLAPLPEGTTGKNTPPAAEGTSGKASEEPKAAPGAATAALPLDPRVADMSTAFQIGPEDLLDISVWKNVELSRTVPVRPDGMVSLPLVNDIKAAGLTPSELRDQITAKLADYIPAPEVSVMIREVHSRKVAVVGAVKTPGRYELRSPMTVLEVLALGGGLTDFASRDKIVIIRYVNGQTTRIPFNYRKIADGAGQDNFFVRPGDIVVVP